MKTYHIDDLETLRLLSDPLKLRLIQAFAEAPKTTKQVAVELDESLTKLYRHIDALHEAGLLTITEERQKRGTVERTFRAVAERFEVDQALFQHQADEDSAAALRDVLRAGEQEILQALALANTTSDGFDPVLMRLRITASPTRLLELRDLLNDWLEAAQQDDEASGHAQAGALIAFYPVHD